MVTVTESIIATNVAERTERHAEASERPRWTTDAIWQEAIMEAARMGYTGYDRYARAAEMITDRYGYR